MAMKVANYSGCKVYNLATGKTMPQWLSENKKRALVKDEEYRKRLELIQDFEMATASQVIKMTPDGEHIIVAGTYPPVVRCYTVSDLAMKFQRGLTCEVIALETLSEDFGKLVFLQSDRTLNFHAPYGTHYSLRVPKFGRDLAYNWEQCDLFVAASGDEVYRLNLETGQFKEPFTLGFSGCNKIHINPVHQLLGCGGETGICEFWDSRSRKAVSSLRVDPSSNVEVSAIKFDTDGLTLGVGTSNGKCIIYDIRSSKPVYTKEHQYELPVIDVTFHNSSRHVISTDKKVVKIWERNEPTPGKVLTNIETPADINGVHVVSDRRGQSGMIMLAGEQSRVMVYFVPQLGPAPRWCSFLEGLTEELEETAGQSVYEDFKFVTRAEIEELGAAGLIGTPMLKGYMHGFFIEMKLYNKLRAVSKPFEYEEHRKKKIQAKIDEKRQSRITALKRLPKVNRDLAEKMLKKGSTTTTVTSSSSATDETAAAVETAEKTGKTGIIDDRFSALFEREEFQRDATSEEFRLRNPSNGNNRNKKSRGGDSEDEMEDLFQPVEEDGVAAASGRGGDDDDDYDDIDDYELESDGDGGDAGNDEDDSDIEAIRADDDAGGGSSSRRFKRKKSGNDSDEEEGQISKASRLALERQKARAKEQAKTEKRQSTSTSKSNSTGGTARSSTGRPAGGNTRTGTGTGAKKSVRMYELAEGVSSSKAVFGHTDEFRSQRKAAKMIGEIPLVDRMKKSTTGGGRGAGGDDRDDGKSFGGGNTKKTKSGSKIRSVKTTKDGIVRELSFMPKEGKVKASNRLQKD